MKEKKTLKIINENEKLIYIKMGFPVMSDRDNLVLKKEEL
jgi:hypothetical protein